MGHSEFTYVGFSSCDAGLSQRTVVPLIRTVSEGENECNFRNLAMYFFRQYEKKNKKVKNQTGWSMLGICDCYQKQQLLFLHSPGNIQE